MYHNGVLIITEMTISSLEMMTSSNPEAQFQFQHNYVCWETTGQRVQLPLRSPLLSESMGQTAGESIGKRT